jgi:hypothetical protein
LDEIPGVTLVYPLGLDLKKNISPRGGTGMMGMIGFRGNYPKIS